MDDNATPTVAELKAQSDRLQRAWREVAEEAAIAADQCATFIRDSEKLLRRSQWLRAAAPTYQPTDL